MNIGIERSIGKYVWFLNSGDRKYPFFEIKKLSNLHADIIYGNTNLKNNKVVHEQTWPSFHCQLLNSSSILFHVTNLFYLGENFRR